VIHLSSKEFNPPTNRLEVLDKSGILNYIQSTIFNANNRNQNEIREPKRIKRDNNDDANTGKDVKCKWAYCDLGCNEGDLSLALASAVIDKLNGGDSMHCLGLDIDEQLISRAQAKKKSTQGDNADADARIVNDGLEFQFGAEFEVCNLNDEDEHLEKSRAYLKSIGKERFDLTSIFSTTMWIHIHGGDEALIAFLKRTCSLTDYLLVEPQPSKW